MKRFTKYLAVITLAIFMVFECCFASMAMSYKTYGRGSMVSLDMYNALINTMRAHADTSASGQLFDTGIAISEADYLQIKEVISRLCLGELYYTVFFNNTGRKNIKIIEGTIDGDGAHFSCYASGPSTSSTNLYVGFAPGFDATAIMAEHDAAFAVLSDAVANSPDDDYEFYNYALNFVRSRGSYDHNKAFRSYCAYSLICEGSGVCEAYTAAIQMMCFLKGKECLYMRSGTHAYNVVPVNGTYYVADGTQSGPIQPASQDLVDYVTSPFFTE